MKTLITALLLLNSTVFAQTFSEKRASEMTAVLQSDALKPHLQQEDGVGNIIGIEFNRSATMDVANRYKVKFSGYGPGGSICSAVVARVDGVDGSISLEDSSCD